MANKSLELRSLKLERSKFNITQRSGLKAQSSIKSHAKFISTRRKSSSFAVVPTASYIGLSWGLITLYYIYKKNSEVISEFSISL